MPFALLIALAVSLGIHAAALFLTDVDLASEPEPMPLMAELKPLPPPQPRKPVLTPPADTPKEVVKPTPPPKKKRKSPRPKLEPAPEPGASPVLSVPVESPAVVSPASEVQPANYVVGDAQDGAGGPAESVEEATASSEVAIPIADAAPPLPERGRIVYRVDRGDSNFEIGRARQEWEIGDGHYQLRSVVETTGLVWLFKAYRVEMESRGQVTGEGLRPDSFSIRRNGKEVREKASFDWENMTVSVADHAPQPLAKGAQDLLSFNYQLRFMALPESGGVLMLATGRKYGAYRLEVIGDEEIAIPAGTLRTLHLRAPGVNTTELWLAYDYLLLPVKIRHVDNKGDSLVQVATEIQLSQE